MNTTLLSVIDLTKVENWDLIELGEFLSINQRDFKLLLGAYRRKNLLDLPNNTYTTVFCIGSSSQYKSRYFRCIGVENPKMNNRYSLTDKGIELLKSIEYYLPIPRQKELKERLNKVIFSF